MKRADVPPPRNVRRLAVERGNSAGLNPSVPAGLCRDHLNKVLSSVTFARAEQLRRLLGWLGGRSLESNPVPPSEKEIGETVLRRKDFDTQTDSVVRKEMSRLREKLRLYYATEGARDKIRIRCEGGYLLRFAWSEPFARESTPPEASPCLLVLPFRAHPDLSEVSSRLVEELLVRIGEQGGTELVSLTTALSYVGRSGDVREFAAECGADFVIEGSLQLRGAEVQATLWLVDGNSGRTERPGRFTAGDTDELARLAGRWLLEQMTRRS